MSATDESGPTKQESWPKKDIKSTENPGPVFPLDVRASYTKKKKKKKKKFFNLSLKKQRKNKNLQFY